MTKQEARIWLQLVGFVKWVQWNVKSDPHIDKHWLLVGRLAGRQAAVSISDAQTYLAKDIQALADCVADALTGPEQRVNMAQFIEANESALGIVVMQ